jgi:hypothetical protein
MEKNQKDDDLYDNLISDELKGKDITDLSYFNYKDNDQ